MKLTLSKHLLCSGAKQGRLCISSHISVKSSQQSSKIDIFNHHFTWVETEAQRGQMILSRLHDHSAEPRFKSTIFLKPLALGRVISDHSDPGNGRNTDYVHKTITRLVTSGPYVFPTHYPTYDKRKLHVRKASATSHQYGIPDLSACTNSKLFKIH